MSNDDSLYTGCPVQHARQFIAGKWQMGILWNLKEKTLGFNALQGQLPGISAKVLMQELEFFVQKKIVDRKALEFSSAKTEYSLSTAGNSLIPVLTAIVEWGYFNLQEEQVTREMDLTPLPAIRAIENGMAERK